MAAKTTESTSFGVWIRDRCRSLDLTQEEIADRVGCSVSAVRKIEGAEWLTDFLARAGYAPAGHLARAAEFAERVDSRYPGLSVPPEKDSIAPGGESGRDGVCVDLTPQIPPGM